MRLANWTRAVSRSAIQEMMSVVGRDDVLSFGLGLPAAELFPTEDYARSLQQVLNAGPQALQYGMQFKPLKSHIVALMAQRGVRCCEEQVFLTAGAQQGVSLLTRLFLDEGATVLCENVIYTGFRQVIEPFRPVLSLVPTNAQAGIDIEAVEAVLTGGTRPAFMYVIPDGHNPLAVSLSPATRARLVELARLYRTPIVEDDPYGLLYYEDAPRAPLRSLDERWVCYVGSFSKILAPGLRLGWIVADRSLINHLSVIKESSDIDTCTLNQRAVSAYLDTGRMGSHLAALRREYRDRRDAMQNALVKYFPHGTRWQEPSSGFFLWVELPRPLDMARLLQYAVETRKVAFIPGKAFHVSPQGNESCSMRLNFSYCAPSRIEEGIARLGQAVNEFDSRRATV